MERLRNLAREALTWEHLSDQQRLVWVAALDLDAVPVQETGVGGRESVVMVVGRDHFAVSLWGWTL